MKLVDDDLYIKSALEDMYNFVVDVLFIWNHLGTQISFEILSFFKIQFFLNDLGWRNN